MDPVPDYSCIYGVWYNTNLYVCTLLPDGAIAWRVLNVPLLDRNLPALDGTLVPT